MACCSVSCSTRATKINITCVSTPAVFACITKVFNPSNNTTSIFYGIVIQLDCDVIIIIIIFFLHFVLISHFVHLIRTCGWRPFRLGRQFALQDTSSLVRSNNLPIRDFPREIFNTLRVHRPGGSQHGVCGRQSVITEPRAQHQGRDSSHLLAKHFSPVLYICYTVGGNHNTWENDLLGGNLLSPSVFFSTWSYFYFTVPKS